MFPNVPHAYAIEGEEGNMKQTLDAIGAPQTNFPSVLRLTLSQSWWWPRTPTQRCCTVLRTTLAGTS